MQGESGGTNPTRLASGGGKGGTQPARGSLEQSVGGSGGGVGGALVRAAATAASCRAPPAPLTSWTGMFMPAATSPSPVQTLAGITAKKLYLDYISLSRNLPTFGVQDKARAQIVVTWFDAMASQDETMTLNVKKKSLPENAAEGAGEEAVAAAHATRAAAASAQADVAAEKMVIAARLQGLVVARLVSAFDIGQQKIPRALQAKSELLCGALEAKIIELKKIGLTIDVSAAAFAQFRAAQHPAGGGSATSSSSNSRSSSSSSSAGEDQRPAKKHKA